MGDSELSGVWKKARSNFMPARGAVYAGRYRDFHFDSKRDPFLDEAIGSYVLVVKDVFDSTFLYDSHFCDGVAMKLIKKDQTGSIAVLGDIIKNGMLKLIEGCKSVEAE
jgi:hypothetical protein